jgi:hypothetical protein
LFSGWAGLSLGSWQASWIDRQDDANKQAFGIQNINFSTDGGSGRLDNRLSNAGRELGIRSQRVSSHGKAAEVFARLNSGQMEFSKPIRAMSAITHF